MKTLGEEDPLRGITFSSGGAWLMNGTTYHASVQPNHAEAWAFDLVLAPILDMDDWYALEVIP